MINKFVAFETKITQFLIGIKFYIVLSALVLFLVDNLSSQIYPASPANWLYPDGNLAATKYLESKSAVQNLDSIAVKWSTKAIAGDVQPLIGNIINNPKLFDNYSFAPNELAAVIGNKIIIVDGTGKVYIQEDLIKDDGNNKEFLKSVSALMDTTLTAPSNSVTNPVVIGLETLEHDRTDSLAITYIVGFNTDSSNILPVKRMAINMRPYSPNTFASIKPFYARKEGDATHYYSTINIGQPTADDGDPVLAPFLRGITQFDSDIELPSYPFSNIGDLIDNRITLAPEVNIAQPSIMDLGGNEYSFILPSYSDPSRQINLNNNAGDKTSTDSSYIMAYDFSSNGINQIIPNRNLRNEIDGTRPVIRTYYVEFEDEFLGLNTYMLVTEGYKGFEGSEGIPNIHLFDEDGVAITNTGSSSLDPPFTGSENHLWSIAVGDVDGVDNTNEFLPYFPHNRGKEVIATQSSRELAIAGSRLSILKYNVNDIPKPPPYDKLSPFDTIATQKISGWVAAVNDLDNDPNGKDEIVLVNGSRIMILNMRDYTDIQFRNGHPFDTLFVHDFSRETISSASIADMEGDGLNDLVVTTHNATYILGTPLKDILQVIQPIDPNGTVNTYCLGDTLELVWKNLVQEQAPVNLKFVYQNEELTNDTLSLITDIENLTDTTRYKLYIADELKGRTGYFLVENSLNPESVFDTSSVVNFSQLEIALDEFEKDTYQVGEEIQFSGTASCHDTIKVEYSVDSENWIEIYTHEGDGTDDFAFALEMPCLDIFVCDSANLESLVHFRLKNIKETFSEYNEIFSFKTYPSSFPLELESNNTADPTKVFRWDLNNFDYICDSISISFSINNGESYTYVDKIPTTDLTFSWKLPLGIPDSVLMRFCCIGSCIQTDTLVFNTVADYLEIVAPNPFNPLEGEIEIVYTVPEDTEVSIRILDQNNRVVAEPVQNLNRNAGYVHVNKWDGLNRNGSYVANGTYYISLEMSVGIKEIYPIFVRKQ